MHAIRLQREKELYEMITIIFIYSGYRFGVDRIELQLRMQGIKGAISLMKFMNLFAGGISNIAQFFTTPNNLHDNAPIESFFANLKTEDTYRYRYRSTRGLVAFLCNNFDFYHAKRPHFRLNGLNLYQVEQKYIEKQNTTRSLL